ncbi:MAG: S-methyl-5-thioribose-1-phosphate isomerase [Candidatus Limnocylindrales bacterium]
MAMTDERDHVSDQAPAHLAGDARASGADLDRRSFFRVFSREAVQTAITVVGAASAVRKGTTAAAVELLGLGIDPEAGADRLAAAMAGGIGGRSPYRLDRDRLLVLDQRRLPGEIIEAVCSSGAEVAGLIREGAVGPGPVLGPLAAYAIALAADRNVASRPFVRSATLRGTANALRNARPDSAAIEVALARVKAAWERARGEPADEAADTDAGAAIAAAVRAEADAIAMETMAGLGRLVEHGAGLLPQPADRPLEVVTIGATGPLSAGVIGTASGVMAAVIAAGRPIHAWVLEARPGRAGARIGAAELKAMDVPATVIADGAAGWLFGDQGIDAVLVGADRIAANGDVANAAGTYPLAAMAARHGVPVYVCALRSTVSQKAATGADLAVVMRGRHELLSMPGEPAAEGIDARVPLGDVTPADLITAYITDAGILHAPFPAATAADPLPDSDSPLESG